MLSSALLKLTSLTLTLLFNSGNVKRVGRCDAYASEYDLEAEEYVPLPKGEVHKKKEIVQDVTLHDLDVANARCVWHLFFICFKSEEA